MGGSDQIPASRRLGRRLVLVRSLYAWVIAASVGLAGVLNLFVLDSFRTPSTQVAYDTFHPHDWGWLFIGSAVWFAVFHRHRSATAPMTFAMLGWASMLGWAWLTVDGASPTASVWPACLALILLLGIMRGGEL